MKIFSKLMLLASMALFGQSMLAQDPSAPPTPTKDASEVTTILGYYGNAADLKVSAYSKNNAYEEITIDGVKVWKLSTFDYVKFDFSPLDLSGRERLHLEIYTPANGMSGLMKIGVHNGSAQSNTPQQVISKGSWKSVDFDLQAVYGKDGYNLSAVRQLILGDTDRAELKTVYVTNVYAYGGTGQGNNGSNEDPDPTPNPDPEPSVVTAPPMPTLPGAQVTTITGFYGDADGLKVSLYSKGSAYEQITIDGVKVWKLDTFDYIKFDFNAIDFTGREKLHIDLYTPENGMKGLMKINLTNGTNSTASKTPQQVITRGQWTSRDYDISATFGGGACDMSVVAQLVFGDTDRSELKTVYVGNIYLYGGSGQGTGTQDPEIPETPDDSTVPALAVPTVAAENVFSIMGYFGEAPGFKLSAYNKGNEAAKVNIDGGTAWKLPTFDYAKFDFDAVDLTAYEKLHVDIYTASNGMGGLMKIGVHNGSAQSNTPQAVISKGSWKSIDFTIADVFGKDGYNLTAVRQLIFGDTDRAELKTVYIGNVYAYNGQGTTPNPDPDPQPGTDVPGPAPKPTHNADDILNVYCDAYAKWANFAPQSWSAATCEEVELAEGDKAWKFSNYDWVAANIGDRNVSSKGFLHMDVFTPAKNGRLEKIQIGFAYWSSGQHYAEPIELTPGQWNSIDLPINLDTFGDFDFTTCNVLRLQGSGKMAGCTIYIDNFYFYGEPQGSEIDPDAYLPIQDSTDGILPDRNAPMLGVNLASASGGTVPGTFGYNYIYPRMEDLYYFKAKGMRLIRLPFRAARVLHNLDDDALDYADGAKSDILALKAVVDEAERLGMWVMLDAHDYSERTIDGVQHKIGDDVYTNEKFARMWRMIAEAFKDNKNIWGFDLQNEPKSNTATLLAAYQPAINAIREVDTESFIVIEGCNWASAYQWSKPATDTSSNLPLLDLVDPQDKLVFQAHCYFDKDNSGTYQGSYDAIATNLDGMKTRLSPFFETMKKYGKRGILGEFGVPYNGATNSDPRYMDLLDAVFDWMLPYQQWATYWCAGAMYEANALSCQPDKNNIYGNYAVEKSTMKVLEKYVPIWNQSSGVEEVAIDSAADEADEITYDLYGRRVAPDTKGIVIRGGKKILNR